MAIFTEVTENEYINDRHFRVKGDNLPLLRGNWQMVQDRMYCRPKLVLFTNRSRMQAFDWYQNQ